MHEACSTHCTGVGEYKGLPLQYPFGFDAWRFTGRDNAVGEPHLLWPDSLSLLSPALIGLLHGATLPD